MNNIHPFRWGVRILSPLAYQKTAVAAISQVARQFGVWLEDWTKEGAPPSGADAAEKRSAYYGPEVADWGKTLLPAKLDFTKPVKLHTSDGKHGCTIHFRCIIEVVPDNPKGESDERQ